MVNISLNLLLFDTTYSKTHNTHETTGKEKEQYKCLTASYNNVTVFLSLESN